MKVIVRVVPFGGNTGAIENRGLDYEAASELAKRLSWPSGWPVPQEGQVVELPGEPVRNLYVRHVAWYPMGGENDPEPFIYLVLGGRSR